MTDTLPPELGQLIAAVAVTAARVDLSVSRCTGTAIVAGELWSCEITEIQGD